MTKQSNRGGKRTDAGRHKIDDDKKRRQVKFYLSPETIDTIGELDGGKREAAHMIDELFEK